MNSMEDTPTFTRIEPVCPRDDCDSQLGIGKPVYAGENSDIAYADVWCSNKECSFTACAQFALVDLLHGEPDPQASLVHAGQIEPREARYQR